MFTDITKIASIINNGGVILYPTDTIWGLGCDATNEQAINKINTIKQRPDNKSYIILVNSITMLKDYVTYIPAIAIELIKTTENPLTIIYQQSKNVPSQASSTDGSIAIRIVNHPFCNALIDAINKPLISTSANISTTPSPQNYNEIANTIKQQVDAIANEKYCINSNATPSTIIKFTDLNSYITIRP